MSSGKKYSHRILRIDVNTGEAKREIFDTAETRKFIGGNGIALKILYDEVPPEVKPLDPENKLIFTTGPLTGTRIPGTGTYQVSAKGPLTGLLVSSQANGYFGARMRHAGYETIILEGATADWKYIWIHDDKVEVRSAAHLMGMDVWETQKKLVEEVGKAKASVACIGPAGENLVPFAGILNDFGHIASTNGPGCVMGSKKIKAVVISTDNSSVDIWDEALNTDIRKNFLAGAEKSGLGGHAKVAGTLGYFDGLPPRSGQSIKNYSTNVFHGIEKFSKAEREEYVDRKKTTCWACPWAHTAEVVVKKGKAKGFKGEEPEYEAASAWSTNIGNDDYGESIRLSYICEAMGLDAKEAGFTISLVMECFENGLITLEDTGGLDLSWGSTDSVAQLLEDVAHRRGFGAKIAGGVKATAEGIGGEALNMGVYVGRGLAPNIVDERMAGPAFYNLALSETGSFYGMAGKDLQIGNTDDVGMLDFDKIGTAMARNSTKWLLMDSYGCCMLFVSGDLLPTLAAINAATGWDMTLEELLKAGERIKTISRAYNLLNGLTAEREMSVSPRYARPPVDGATFGVITQLLHKNVFTDYYLRSGWDEQTSKPLPETLRDLGLDNIIKDLW